MPTQEELQSRINSNLMETPSDRARSSFSAYLPEARDVEVEDAFVKAFKQQGGGLSGIAAALDIHDQLLSAGADPGEVRYALLRFLQHLTDLSKLGLRVPTLQERSAWKLRPSRNSESTQPKQSSED